MKRLLLAFSCVLGASCGGYALNIGSSPAGHSALCYDGTYSDAKKCSEACSTHAGVKEWYIKCESWAGARSSGFVMSDSNDTIAGSWVGSWANRKDNLEGTIRLNIEENAITGTFVNRDTTVDSLFHGHVDHDGIEGFYVDIQQTPFENSVEYPADISLNTMDAKLAGTITIQIKGTEEIREVELIKCVDAYMR